MEAVETLLEGWAVRDSYPWKPPPSTLGLRCDLDSSPKQTAKVLSFLTPDECKNGGGLPGVAVQGIFTDPDSTAAGFRVNRVFVEFMHTVIRTVGPSDPSLLEAAASTRERLAVHNRLEDAGGSTRTRAGRRHCRRVRRSGWDTAG